MLIVIPEFIAHAQCHALAAHCIPFGGQPRREERPAHWFVPHGAVDLTMIRHRCLTVVRQHAGDGLLIELTLLTGMQDGDSHVLHADSERRVPGGGWEPNHTPHRDYVTILYTWPPRRGGQLSIPDLGVAITPQTGLLVGMPTTRQYEHAVTPVLDGTRCALVMWYTLDAGRREIWPWEGY